MAENIHEPDSPSLDSKIDSYEELFKLRYSDQDEDYIKTQQTPTPPPPCVENWFSRPKRSFDWTRNQQDNRNRDYRGGGGYRGNNYRDNRDRSYQHSYNSGNGGQYHRRGQDERGYDPSYEPNPKYFRGGRGRGYHNQ